MELVLNKGFGLKLWPLISFLVNRSPTSALVGKTPMEVWFGKKPSIRHLHFFG